MDNTPPSIYPPPRKLQLSARLLLVALILIVAAALAAYLLKSAPKATKRPPQKGVALVQVMTVEPGRYQVRIAASGQMVAAREVSLQARVSGQVVAVAPDFDHGSVVAAGQELVRIDPVDYQLAVADAEAQLADAEAALALELGQQQVAQREWQLFQDQSPQLAEGAENAALALREPYLKKAQAAVTAAEVALDRARLNLERTRITVPFDALVVEKQAELGSQLSTTTSVATLVAVDRYWLQLAVPMEKLSWIAVPQLSRDQGSEVVLRDQGRSRRGRVERLLGNLEQQGRMARLQVAVDDPLDLQQPLGQRQPLLLGEYVEAEILGADLDGVIKLPRSVVHNGDQVWLAQEGALHIRPVEIVWRDRHSLYVAGGLSAGDQVIVSPLPAPLDGLPVRIDGAAAALSTEER